MSGRVNQADSFPLLAAIPWPFSLRNESQSRGKRQQAGGRFGNGNCHIVHREYCPVRSRQLNRINTREREGD